MVIFNIVTLCFQTFFWIMVVLFILRLFTGFRITLKQSVDYFKHITILKVIFIIVMVLPFILSFIKKILGF